MRIKFCLIARACAFAVPVLLLAAAQPCAAAPPFSEELAVMQTTVDSFNACAARLEKATTASEMATALSFAADELKRVFPAMLEVSKSHPEWGRTPPPEVKPTMDRFDAAYDRFLVTALKRAEKLANENQDNAGLQESFGRVNRILYAH